MPNRSTGILGNITWLGRSAALAAVLLAVTAWVHGATAAQGQTSGKTASAGVPAVLAQAAATPSGVTGGEQAPPMGVGGKLPSFIELYSYSPVINAVIGVLSVLAVAMFLAFLVSVGTGHMIPVDFSDDVMRLISAKKYGEVAEYCRRHRRVFAASIIQRCVENADKDHATLLSIVDAEGRRRGELIWNRIGMLLDISQIAPMLGLLGTVLGLIQAFYVLPHQSTSLNSAALAYSIGGAMSATFFGLIVAVVCVIFYSILKGRATVGLAEVERVVHSIADHMKRGEA